MRGDDKGPADGRMIAGVMLIVFGMCMLAAGGGCTIVLVADLFSQFPEGSGRGQLPISIAALAAGPVAIVLGVKLWRRGRYG